MDIQHPLATDQSLPHKLALNVFLYTAAWMVIFSFLATVGEFVAFATSFLTWITLIATRFLIWIIPIASLRRIVTQGLFHNIWLIDTNIAGHNNSEADLMRDWMPLCRALWAVYCAHMIWQAVKLIVGIWAILRDEQFLAWVVRQRGGVNAGIALQDIARDEVDERQAEGEHFE
jgi:hypothetical protein